MATSVSASHSKIKSIKELAKLPNPTSIPSNYTYFADPSASFAHSGFADSIPVVDLSHLLSGTHDIRSKVIQELGKACQEWGLFMVVNHGMPETLRDLMINKCGEFFNVTAEEKQEFEGKNVFDPIRCGTSFNTTTEEVNFWRDYVKFMVHPEFHCPTIPHDLSEISAEYCKHARGITRILLQGISASLGLDEMEMERSMDLDMGQQILVANYYPPCPQPELAIGLSAHSDHDLLTLLAQNQVGGLQAYYKDQWITVDAIPNSFIAVIGDQIEIFSNGTYKSVLHRATVNNKATRISIAVFHGPSMDAVVSPTLQLVEGASAKYKPIMYRKYFEHQQSNRLDGKSALNIVKISP